MPLIQFYSHWRIRKEAKFGQKGLGLRVVGGSPPRSTWDTRLSMGAKPAVGCHWGHHLFFPPFPISLSCFLDLRSKTIIPLDQRNKTKQWAWLCA